MLFWEDMMAWRYDVRADKQQAMYCTSRCLCQMWTSVVSASPGEIINGGCAPMLKVEVEVDGAEGEWNLLIFKLDF